MKKIIFACFFVCSGSIEDDYALNVQAWTKTLNDEHLLDMPDFLAPPYEIRFESIDYIADASSNPFGSLMLYSISVADRPTLYTNVLPAFLVHGRTSVFSIEQFLTRLSIYYLRIANMNDILPIVLKKSLDGDSITDYISTPQLPGMHYLNIAQMNGMPPVVFKVDCCTDQDRIMDQLLTQELSDTSDQYPINQYPRYINIFSDTDRTPPSYITSDHVEAIEYMTDDELKKLLQTGYTSADVYSYIRDLDRKGRRLIELRDDARRENGFLWPKQEAVDVD